MSTLLRLRPWFEPVFAVVFFALWCVAEAGRYQGGSAIVTLAAICAAVALARFQPVISLVLLAAVIALQVAQVLRPPQSTTWPILLAGLAVVFVVAWEGPRRVAFVGLALGLPLSMGVGYLVGLGLNSWVGATAATSEVSVFLSVSAVALGLYAGAWALGFALRSSLRATRARRLLVTTAAQLGATELELGMARERDRIARDVHDVLAHSLAVVIAQADGARFIGATEPERADAALTAIAEAARAALIDVRTLVEGLRDESGDTPQPGLDDLDALLEQIAGAGMVVDAQHFGERKELTPTQQLAVYRIVQESLTNALRHADPAATTRLSFDWRGPGLAVGITSTGTGADEPAPGGHGIRGMKDRARLAGGWLTAGASAPDGEFVVTAFIPAGHEGVAA